MSSGLRGFNWCEVNNDWRDCVILETGNFGIKKLWNFEIFCNFEILEMLELRNYEI